MRYQRNLYIAEKCIADIIGLFSFV